VAQMWDDKTGRSQTAATALQVFVSCAQQNTLECRTRAPLSVRRGCRAV